MTGATRASVTRTIAAPAADIFQIVTDPAKHVEIDGSGMLMAAPEATPMGAVGDSFIVNMDREPLGDIPLGKYTVENTVTKFEPDSAFEWNVGAPGGPPFGHVYGYELSSVGDGTTEVTLYCDWTDVPQAFQEAAEWPIVPVEMLERSLENLERISAGSA